MEGNIFLKISKFNQFLLLSHSVLSSILDEHIFIHLPRRREGQTEHQQ
jgi:hypothetical protein